MSALFGSKNSGPTRINQVQINQSVLGYAVPVVMGRGKVQQSILWVDGFSSRKINASGKGIFGGKGSQYEYSADVIAGLCAGPIVGIGDVWSGQSWLSNTAAQETYTITGGTPVYAPINAANMTADGGVGVITAYSISQADLGSTAPTSLSGSHVRPMLRVPYGTTLGSGEYSVSPSNQYNFSAADAGVTVELFYSFALSTIQQQETVLIPSNGIVQVGGTLPFAGDVSVRFYTGPNDGVRFNRVGGGGWASYTVSGSAPATYHFSAANAGDEVVITYRLNNSANLPAGTQKSIAFELYEGNPEQAPWALTSSNFAGAALGYTGIAYVAYAPMDLGYSAQIQQNVFEVFTPDAWGGGVQDCNPVQCIGQVLTNPTWGLGAGPVPFPVSAIDNGAGGTWGNPKPNFGATDGTASSWFAANGFFISPVIDRQDTAASIISRWLEAGQCAAFMSEGLLKLVPYGDTSTAGNGAIWTAPSEFACGLDDTCFVQKNEGDDPVKISSSPYMDAYNVVQVQWNNRANQYAPEITPESDEAATNRYGRRIEDPQTWDFITTLPAATFAANMRVRRNVYTRNTFEFALPYRYSWLEPMDVVYVTTSSVWAAGLNNINLNVNNLPVRIVKIVDNPDGTLDVTAEDYPFGAHQPSLYNKAIAAGVAGPNYFADPGNTEAVIFEASNRLTGFKGNQIWIGATGNNAAWGGCNILVSMDGATYRTLGTIEQPARLGTVASDFPSEYDPDTIHALIVDLAHASSGLESATHADADAGNTLCYLGGGEVIAYSNCTLTGASEYTINGYVRRAQMGTTAVDHPTGTAFLRLDEAVFQYTYDPSWAGKTVHFKFQSFNAYGNSAQDPATLTAVPFTIPGLNGGTIDASTGLLVGSQALPPNIPWNTANNCVLSAAWDSGNNWATISGNGPGGAGTSWNFYTGGQAPRTYPSFTIGGLAAAALYFALFDTRTETYSVTTAYSGTLPDYLIVLGELWTPAAGSTTTTTGGGGASTDTGSGGSGSTSPTGRGLGGTTPPPQPSGL